MKNHSLTLWDKTAANKSLIYTNDYDHNAAVLLSLSFQCLALEPPETRVRVRVRPRDVNLGSPTFRNGNEQQILNRKRQMFMDASPRLHSSSLHHSSLVSFCMHVSCFLFLNSCYFTNSRFMQRNLTFTPAFAFSLCPAFVPVKVYKLYCLAMS